MPNIKKDQKTETKTATRVHIYTKVLIVVGLLSMISAFTAGIIVVLANRLN